MKKTQDAEEFVRKVSAIRNELKQRKNERERAIQEKLSKEAEEQQRKDQAEAERKLQIKEEEKAKHVEELGLKKREREMLAKLATDHVPRKEYLYQKMTQQYEQEVEMPELEKRKREIAEKRNVYKPIRLVEIAEFQKKHDEQMMQSATERKKEQLRRLQEQFRYNQKVDKELKSVFTEEVIKKDSAVREKIKEEEDQVKERHQRMKSYAKMVKESHQPTVSSAKALELKKQVEQLKHQPRKPHKTALTPAGRNNSLNPSQTPLLNLKTRVPQNVKKVPTKRNSQSTRSIDAAGDSKMKKPKIDYLMEMEKSRAQVAGPRRSLLEQSLLKLAADEQLSAVDRYQLIKAQTEALEQSARQKEELLAVRKGDMKKAVEIGGEVSDMYVNSMRAKLALLNT